MKASKEAEQMAKEQAKIEVKRGRIGKLENALALSGSGSTPAEFY